VGADGLDILKLQLSVDTLARFFECSGHARSARYFIVYEITPNKTKLNIVPNITKRLSRLPRIQNLKKSGTHQAPIDEILVALFCEFRDEFLGWNIRELNHL